MRRCEGCGGSTWRPLPDPSPQSMASDLRVLPYPLGKVACTRCALARRAEMPRDALGLFSRGYALYAHGPGTPLERTRQVEYARWIARALPAPPSRIVDVGCGNGSLLAALGDIWPGAERLGCDASAESVGHAAAAGLRVWQGTAATLPAAAADLVLAVNVIEHTPEPERFLRDLVRAAAPGATLIVICPDGSRAGGELLIADHLFSLTPHHLEAFSARAGIRATARLDAPPPLAEFQLLAGTPGVANAEASGTDADAINGRRLAMLGRWATLDARLSDRLASAVVAFGGGEAAGLLRAYAPGAWSRVRACTADVPVALPFSDLPFIALDALAPDSTVLVAVRPADQSRVAERLRRRFANVTTWYDLVQDDDE